MIVNEMKHHGRLMADVATLDVMYEVIGGLFECNLFTASDEETAKIFGGLQAVRHAIDEVKRRAFTEQKQMEGVI